MFYGKKNFISLWQVDLKKEVECFLVQISLGQHFLAELGWRDTKTKGFVSVYKSITLMQGCESTL